MKKVKNIIGTSDDNCSCCKSWLEHWEKYSGEPAVFCSVSTCNEVSDLKGAHVYEFPDKTPKIIPLCSKHNMSDVELTVKDDVFFAPIQTIKK